MNYDPSCADPYANVPPLDPESPGQLHLLSEFEVLVRLMGVKKTAPGSDQLPYWFFKNCAFQLAPVITHLFNLTLITGKPPIHWKKAMISPVPKVSKPNTLSDLRPISVTPILSRILERIIVQRYLIPSLPPDELADQCAYRISGSTTAAIIDILHHVTNLLESNKYVRCLFIDFTKAFDTVNHPKLFSKLHRLSLPPTILAWIVNFLTGRTQNVIFAGVQSSPLPITRSIVQGSGLGPALYITYKADLHTISPQTLFVNLLMILLLAILKIQM